MIINEMHMNPNKSNAWMRHLAFQYKSVREQYPHDKLMIVFDIDGTILDMRYMMTSVLQGYDRVHSTNFFSSLNPHEIFMHENDVETLLDHMRIDRKNKQDILSWYGENYWSPAFVAGPQRHFNGVLDVIRWFQIQPNTLVGLNTGRSESLRQSTLASLNALGEEYRVNFSDDLLYMNRSGTLPEGKVAGLRHFESMGFRIFAVIDNEPENLKAMDDSMPGRDILLLHADTLFESSPAYIPESAAAGNRYDLTELIPDRTLPHHIQFVWHGVNNEQALQQFLISNVHWAELHVRYDLGVDRIILRHRSFEDFPLQAGEQVVLIEDILSILKETDRGVKLDVKDFGLIRRLIPILKDLGFEGDHVWINGTMDKLYRGGLQVIREEFPGSILQCPVDFLGMLMMTAPHEAQRHLEMLSRWGVSRFSVKWKTRNSRKIINCLQDWGYDVNIYNIPDLEAFLQAVLMMPKSVTSCFNFPKWFMYGNQDDTDSQDCQWRMTA